MPVRWTSLSIDETTAAAVDAERRAQRVAFLEHSRRRTIYALGHRLVTESEAQAAVAEIDAELATLKERR